MIQSTLSDHPFQVHEIGARGHHRGTGGDGDGMAGYNRGRWNQPEPDEPAKGGMPPCVVHVLGGVALTPEGKRMLQAPASKGGPSEDRPDPFLDGSHARAGRGVPGPIREDSGDSPVPEGLLGSASPWGLQFEAKHVGTGRPLEKAPYSFATGRMVNPFLVRAQRKRDAKKAKKAAEQNPETGRVPSGAGDGLWIPKKGEKEHAWRRENERVPSGG